MELHIQKCQNCGSRDHRNILIRDTQQKVFVQCRECESFVARYILTSGGYFHEGRGFESFLRSIERDASYSSGRDLQIDFDSARKSSEQEFVNIIKLAKEKYNDELP